MVFSRSTHARSALPAVIGAVLLAAIVGQGPMARAQVSADESAKRLKPAVGLDATLWASEPMVLNPTNMEVDSRGRVWISEGLNYRLTHGGKPFKKIEGADKIKILEDTDGDGKADKVTIFAENIYPIPMGLALEEHYGPDGKYQGCKVYVGNSPDLLVLEDTDGDDKADKRSALLTGFGGVDSDHGVHGMVLGLDGKLYFTHGDGCCSFEQSNNSHGTKNFDVVDKSGRHVSSDQLANTLRVNRDGTQFEIIADRQRNNYETSLNAFGNVFTSDNDDDGNRGSRVIWVMDGGNYGYRTPGSPRHWGEDVPGIVPKLVGTGNGSPCGITVYEGSLLGPEYLGAALEAEAGTRQINLFPLTREGAAFRTESKVLLASDDPWFRPVDMTAAPDGSLFVADWYDAGVGGHNFSDQTTGRIYRVTRKGAKAVAPKLDFATVHGLIDALKSPVIATQDAARRSLIEKANEDKPAVETALVNLFSSGQPHERGRALWVLYAVAGPKAAIAALADNDPRIREQAVRILGRDVRDNGKVEYGDASKKLPPPAEAFLEALLPIASDPDAGVRRELILALRNLPTAKVGDALKTLARTWDGQDRWYLEALGLAFDKRESDYITSLFDGTLFGDLDLNHAGDLSTQALPPYFPVDRNEAYIAAGTKSPQATNVGKTLGLAWRLHRSEILPLLGRLLPKLSTPELQQAADDVLSQMRDGKTATVLAELTKSTDDPARKRQLLATLARKLDTAWRDAQRSPQVVEATTTSLNDPELRLEAVGLAAATEDPRYVKTLIALATDAKSSEDLKVAAVEAAARLKDSTVKDFLIGLITDAKGKANTLSTSTAAVRSLARVEDPRKRLTELLQSSEYPVGLRREALRTFARYNDGGLQLIELAKANKLPADLKTEATTVVNTHPDRRVRDAAASVLPLPKSKSGRTLPPFYELVRREGKADHGREIFFKTGANGCASCHRVQGQGQWIGPDLSTIGTKYGRDELIRSILNPSAAIGYNYRSLTIGLDDGRVITGLPVEDTADRLVIKTAEGERVTIKPSSIEVRKTADISLMPEGLAETMEDQDFIDLLTFLTTLRQPVSIVGQYQVVGPLAEANGASAFDTALKVDTTTKLRGPEGQSLAWRRLNANAESLVDLSTLVGNDPAKSAYLFAPIVSPIAQQARVVLDTKGDVKAWLNGKSLDLPVASEGQPRVVFVDLPQGSSDLLIRVAGGANVSLVTSVVSDKPIAFQAEETKVSAR